MNLSDQQLDQKALKISKNIHQQSLLLIEVLTEINSRHSYADHGFSNLFNYIVKYLGFSESQAAVYNNVVKSRITHDKQVKQMIQQGEVSLSIAGMVGQKLKNRSTDEKIEVIKSLKGKSRRDAKREIELVSPVRDERKTVSLRITKKNFDRLDKLKQKLGNMSDNELIEYLLNKEETDGKVIKENKSITAKTKAVLLRKAGHRCEFVSHEGTRCNARSHLQVEHIKPRGKGGRNNPENLKILCFAHNQRSAVLQFGINKMSYFARQSNKKGL